MSRPDKTWIHDWEIRVEPERERTVSMELVQCFSGFWDAVGLDGRQKPPETVIQELCMPFGKQMQMISDHFFGGETCSEALGDAVLVSGMVCRRLSKHLKTRGRTT